MGNNEKNLEYFKSLKYDILVRRGKDKFTLFIHQLCLFAEDENLEKAYEKLESEKEKYFRQIIEYNYQDHIVEPEPKGSKNQERNFWNLVPFFVKLAVITTVVVVLLAKVDDISSTFKHLKRAAKSFTKTNKGYDIKDVTANVTTTALKAFDNYQENKEAEKRWKSEYTLVNPVEFHANTSMDEHPVEHAFDSDPATFWHSTSYHLATIPISLDIKFKQPRKLRGFSMSSRQEVAGTQGPDAITIEGSNDNKAWKHYDMVTELTWVRGETKNLIIKGNNNTYTYYRFKLDDGATATREHLSIVEMKLYIKSTED